MQSYANFVGSLIKSSKLAKSYWEAVGDMRRVFIDELAPAIRDYLERSLEPSLDELQWSLYMCGYRRDTAKPYLVFSSPNADNRKRAIELIRGSGILRQFPHVKMRHTPYMPGLRVPMEPLGDQVPVRNHDASHTSVRGRSFYYAPSENGLGVSIFVKGLTNEDEMRQATAGGIICVGSRFFYLTVFHVFEQDEQMRRFPADTCQDYSQDDSEGDEEEEEEEEEKEEEEDDDDDGGVNIDSDGSSWAEISIYSSCVSQFSEENESIDEARSHGILSFSRLHDFFASSLAQRSRQASNARCVDSDFIELGPPDMIRSHKLDYLLIEIHDRALIRPNFLSASRIPLSNIGIDKVARIDKEDCQVAVLTATRGVLRGVLFATPRYMWLSKAVTMRKTFCLKLDGIVQRGDCGSWVVDANSGHLYGHIFGGGAGTKIAYIIPAAEIFDDIEAQFAEPVILPSEAGELVQSRSRISGNEPTQPPDCSGLPQTPTLEDRIVSKVNIEDNKAQKHASENKSSLRSNNTKKKPLVFHNFPDFRAYSKIRRNASQDVAD